MLTGEKMRSVWGSAAAQSHVLLHHEPFRAGAVIARLVQILHSGERSRSYSAANADDDSKRRRSEKREAFRGENAEVQLCMKPQQTTKKRQTHKLKKEIV